MDDVRTSRPVSGAGDTWEPGSSGWYTCGDFAIALDPVDPEQYLLWRLSDGERLAGERLHPSGGREGSFGWFLGGLDEAASERDLESFPADGLEAWFDAVQLGLDERAETEIEKWRLEREEWERSRLGRTAEELLAEVPSEMDWLVPGYLARGWATKLAGREKGGKGTVEWYIVGKLERGEDSVFGPCTCGSVTTYIVTEEPPESVREKADAFGLRRSRIVYGWELKARTYRYLPRGADRVKQWKALVMLMVKEALADGHTVLFCDNVSRSAGIEDEGGVELGRAVEVLQDACREAGLSLLFDHHHKKGRDSLENKSRGGTAIAGATDINIEMERVGGLLSRKRRLTAIGRTRAACWVKCIELNEDGTDYFEIEDPRAGRAGDEDEDEGVTPERPLKEDKLMADWLKLNTRDSWTAKEFGAIVGVQEATARKRLAALIGAQMAEVRQGTSTAKGREPNTYAPLKPPEPDPSLKPNPRDSSAGSDGSHGSKEPRGY